MGSLETIQGSMPIVIDFIIYSLLMLGIGFYFKNKNKTSKDYFIGNKSLGPVISALSAGASDMSSWLLMGLPGAVLLYGFNQSYIAIGLSIGALLNWLFVAKRLRIYSDIRLDCITIPDFFETRFDDKSRILRTICAIVILVFFTIYISSGFVAGAKLFEAVFGLSYDFGLCVIAIIIVFYTFLGGYKAVCWTDLFQGLLMMSALIVIAFVMLNELGGISSALTTINEVSNIKNVDYISMSKGLTIVSIVSSLAWGLGYFGQPHILIRFMSIKSIKDIPVATFVGISWMVVSLFSAVMIGFLGIAYLYKFDLTLNDADKIFILMSQILFNPWVAGILLSAILAAIMSTASSQLLISGATLAEDFYKRILKVDVSNEKIIFISRICVLIVSIIAFIISTDKNSSILNIVGYAWAGFGSAFGSVVVFALFYKHTSRLGAIFGMIAGSITVIVWENLEIFGIQKAGITELYSIIPGFLVASVFIVIGSFIEKSSVKCNETYDKMLEKL